MKILQESTQKMCLKALAQFEISLYVPQYPKEVILLLHGLSERGKRIFRKLAPYLPEDAIVLAPNAPFPIERNSNLGTSYGFSWYFYNRHMNEYFLNQDMARDWLRELLKAHNPQKLPLTIIGFSQGGYLAPLVGLDHSYTKRVIGLGCEFRDTIIKETIPFDLFGLHGSDDEIITKEQSQLSFNKIKHFSQKASWEIIPFTKHEISAEMGMRVKEIIGEI